MPRQLKTYVTTSGFFELAVAAPTMKAALQIWGASPDLFRRGYAKETNESAIVKATMAKPGTVLKRAVGGQGAFKERADLPDVSTWRKSAKNRTPTHAPERETRPRPEPEPVVASPIKAAPDRRAAAERAAERKAARLDAAALKKRAREAVQAEAAERKARERRQKEIEKATNAIRAAQAAHDERIRAIDVERENLEQRAREEDERWDAQKRDLDAALRDAQ